MDSKFILLCGSCHKLLPPNSGTVLSCGDFLCTRCSSLHEDICPLCNKNNIAKLKLEDTKNLPEEVIYKTTNITLLMERLHGAMEFQLKSYKRLLRKLITERNQLNK
jgi:hypothetical protein